MTNVFTLYFKDGLIYALGGYNGRTRMSSVERYYPDKNQWEMTTPMNKQRSDASAASLGGKVNELWINYVVRLT